MSQCAVIVNDVRGCVDLCEREIHMYIDEL
jgi:hypothetical protein